MKQAFLGAEINKGYVDITISDKKNILKKLVYFDVAESYHNLLQEIELLFNNGVELLHIGFVSAKMTKNHWLKSVTNTKFNIQIHTINNSNILEEFKKLTPQSISTLLICNYLKSHTNTLKNLKLKNSRANAYLQNKPFLEFLDIEVSKTSTDDVSKFIEYNDLLNDTKENLEKQLNNILQQTIPQAILYCKQGVPLWLVNLIMHYPSQEKLKKARITNLKEICNKNNVKAVKLVASIRLSEIIETNKQLNYLTKKICESLLAFSTETKKIVNYTKRNFKSENIEKLKPFTCVDKLLSYSIINEIGDVNQFKSADEMAKHFGVHINEENDLLSLQNKTRYTKYKVFLFKLVKKIIENNPYFKQLYAQKIALKFSHIEAIEFIEYKLTRVIYGLLKTPEKIEENKIETNVQFENTVKKKVLVDIQAKENEKARKYFTKKPSFTFVGAH